MNRLITKLMVVLMAMFMMVGVVTTPVRAEDTVPEDWFTFEEEEESVQGTMAEAVESVEYLSGTVEAESQNYKVSVSMNEDALIPAGTEVRVTELEEDSDAYKEAKEAVETEKEAGVEGFAAFDITLYYGEEVIEPSATVTVSVEAKNVPADAQNLEIQHLSEKEDDSIVVELVAAEGEETPGTIELNDTQAVAEFDVDSFSTFVLTWGTEVAPQSATIIWGYYDGDTFKELEEGSTITLDTTAATVSLENTYSGYYMIGATYTAPGSSESVDISPARLTKTDSGWQITTVIEAEDESTTTQTVDVASGSVIRVVYGPVTTPRPSGSTDKDVPSPVTEKDVADNGDGTYTITLDVTGSQISETTKVGANVLVVLDRTNSMSNWMGNKTRLAVAKAAIGTLVEALDCDTNDIDLAFVAFASTGTVVQTGGQTWTKDADAFMDTVNGTGQQSGTNWESGLYYARDALNSRDGDNTYVIFLTDGEPNRRGTTSAQNANTSTAISYALVQAQAITAMENVSLYGIFCGSDSGYNNLNNMINNAGGVETINGTNEQDIEDAFSNIAQTIVSNLGASDVAVDDGVPSLSGISANVIGEAGGYTYYYNTHNPEQWVEWTNAPGAIYSKDNGVTWDLSSVGTLPAGTTYRIKFTVWPSQAAYDLIADLNNGIKTMSEAELIAAGIVNDGGVYKLKTNTHLNTTYTFNGTTYTDSNTWDEEQMLLPTETISIKKLWNNKLDSQDGEPVTLIVTKDGAEYLKGPKTTVSAPSWTVNDIHISMGNISTHKNAETGKVEAVIHETGHDYTVEEPEDLKYYWELSAEIYHPMVINGTPEMLVLDESATSADNEKTFEINGKFYSKPSAETQEPNTIHATNDRRSYLNLTKTVTGTGAPEDDFFKFEVKIYNPNGPFKGDESYNDDPQDDKNSDIWFSIYDPKAGSTVMDTKATFNGKEVDIVSGGNAQQKASDGYWHFDNVDGGSTVTIYIKAGWNVRFINLRSGTKYEITEAAFPAGYEYTKAEGKAAGDAEAEDPTIDNAAKKASGTINKPNTDYTVTYTNNYLGVFYVYHSSDLEVERIYMTDSRVVEGKFDIVSLTKAGTLYGGYYSDYTGKSADYDSSKLTYTDNKSKDDNGNEYTYKYIADNSRNVWQTADELTVNGREMEPEQDVTYYLKEVPAYYSLPYTQYTYNRSDKLLRNMWFISAIDDLHYGEAGFFVETITKDGKKTAEVVDTLTVTTTSGGTSVTMSPKSVFGNKGGLGNGVQAGYLTYLDASGKVNDEPQVTETIFTPYWKTPDGIIVTGTKTRTVTFNNRKVGSGGMSIADADNAERFPEIEE